MSFRDYDIELTDGYDLEQNVIDQAVVNNSQVMIPTDSEQASVTMGPTATEYSFGEQFRSIFAAAQSPEQRDTLVEMFKPELSVKQPTLLNFGMLESGITLTGNTLFNSIKDDSFSGDPKVAKSFVDKVQYNFEMNIGSTNIASVPSVLDYWEVENGAYLMTDRFGVNRKVKNGIMDSDDAYKVSILESAFEKAVHDAFTEIQIDTSQVAEAVAAEKKGPEYIKKNAATQISDKSRIINPYVGGAGPSKVDQANRAKAVAYMVANAYNHTDHDGFHYFSPETGGGSDCTNIVSQALFEGGIPMTKEWYWRAYLDPQSTYDGTFSIMDEQGNLTYEGIRAMLGKPSVDATKSWLQPDALFRYFSQPGRSYGVSRIISVDEIPRVAAYIRAGDIIAFDNFDEGNPRGYINHVAMVTGVEDGKILYSGHTEDRQNASLQEILQDKYRGHIYFIHVNYDQFNHDQ